MKKVFRSRGISLRRLRTDNSVTVQNRIYYEPDSEIFKMQYFKELQNESLMFFEYSADTSDNKIVSLNFHVDLKSEYASVYNGLPADTMAVIKKIPVIFGESFRNYTIGYRLKDNIASGISYYFYPTILKKDENRYGIKGITDNSLSKQYINNFLKYLEINDSENNEIMDAYCNAFNKFKGLSISVTNGNITDYKIYARIDNTKISELLKMSGFSIPLQCLEYGDIVLTALRFDKNGINGLNLYYFK